MRYVLADSFFVIANYIEAGLWTTISAAFFVHAILSRGRAQSLVAVITFLAFGISDVVEATTGAWWRPWWLLVWKGTCLVVFAVLLARYVITRRTARPAASNHPSRPPAEA
jgi:hypothetical protein